MNIKSSLLKTEGARTVYDACRSLVSHYFPEYKSLKTISSLQRAIKERGISVKYRESRFGNEGMIEFRPSGHAEITVRSGASVRQQRFTLAHELGHWMLRKRLFPDIVAGNEAAFAKVQYRKETRSEEERLVNLIAAELLLPMDIVRDRVPIDQCGERFRAVRQLCLECQVSRTTVVRRMADVFCKNILWLQLVPFRFNDLTSAAEIDDAMLISSGESTLYAAETTQLIEDIKFEALVAAPAVRLSVKSARGLFDTEFDVDVATNPVPHAYAMAFLEPGWRDEINLTQSGIHSS